MEPGKLLNLSLAPSIFFILLSLVSIVLTSHYWVLTDYITGRWLVLPSTFPEKTKFKSDDVIVDYTESSTNATIVSGCLCLTAAVNAIVAYFKLKNGTGTDWDGPRRSFWSGSAMGMSAVGFCSALASLITHFTDKGSDEFGCTKTTGKTTQGGQPFTNRLCSREIATCKFMGPETDRFGSMPTIDRDAVRLACNEAVAVKWLQIVLMLNAVVVIAVFATQARVQRNSKKVY